MSIETRHFVDRFIPEMHGTVYWYNELLEQVDYYSQFSYIDAIDTVARHAINDAREYCQALRYGTEKHITHKRYKAILLFLKKHTQYA